MELTEEQIQKLKSLVRVSMDMHDIDNWKNGDYFGDARKFWKGAMSGIDLWVKQLRESQNSSTSDEALHIGSVVDSKPNEKAALKHAVEAIYFADNSDYLSGLYGVVCSLTGLDEPTEEDIKKLYKELRF